MTSSKSTFSFHARQVQVYIRSVASLIVVAMVITACGVKETTLTTACVDQFDDRDSCICADKKLKAAIGGKDFDRYVAFIEVLRERKRTHPKEDAVSHWYQATRTYRKTTGEDAMTVEGDMTLLGSAHQQAMAACGLDPLLLAKTTDHQSSVAPTAKQKTVATESSNETSPEPGLFFRVFGTEPDEGPGQHYAGACKLDAESENLLLFSIHSPGHRNGGSKGGSSQPTIKFSRTMKMDWVSGIDADQYQSYSIDMRLQFEKSRRPLKEQNAGLTSMAEVSFGKQQVPIYRIDEVTVPGVLQGYHAWFRVMQTNHAPYTAEYSGTTGDLYAHLSMRKIGRTRSDNDPWTETVVTTIFESFYTQDCFVDYLKAYVPMREATSVTIVD